MRWFCKAHAIACEKCSCGFMHRRNARGYANTLARLLRCSTATEPGATWQVQSGKRYLVSEIW
jgi:hypothetical protein